MHKTCLQKQIKYVITNALHLSGLGDQLKASLRLNVCSTVVAQQSRATQAPRQMNPHHAELDGLKSWYNSDSCEVTVLTRESPF